MSDRPSNSWLLYTLLTCSLALNVFMLGRQSSGAPNPAPAITEAPVAGAPVAGAPAAAAVPGAVAATQNVAPAQPAGGQPEATGASTSGEWNIVHARVEQSLARTFQINAGQDGDALSGVYTRLFVWDLDLRRDLQNGDAVAAAWRKGPDGLPEIAAASLQSVKLGRVSAYHWKSPEDRYPSYWHLDGTEAALRLKGGPLEQYDQITSLLKDRPTHKGMDFKTPVGTEVHSPRAGTVTRTNWNWSANGNCIEVRYDDGVLAKFLHLSENRVAEGQRVSPNQVIALSGNTGHTTAPHLHYQLNRDEKVIDPVDYHGTTRRSLNADEIAALKRDVAEFETMIGEPGAAVSAAAMR